ncbi:NADPH-dependent FMN reductase [Demequina pelophila]|uniref:NADPH-dependent FMN reductase n=1 Tax=Demequina pelophila TaxID=1638984 RepID=UPI000782AC33|nr:NADPH-dependent FMN reductase [Demequina pelophila]
MAVIGLLVGQLPQARTTRALASTLHTLVPRGTTLVELSHDDLPGHGPYDDEPAPASALAWKRALGALDGLVIVAPTHGRSLPGSCKHALDWATATPSALATLPVVIAGAAAPGREHFAALVHLRGVLADARATVMGQPERTLAVEAADFDDDGRCVNAELEAEARDLLRAAAGFVAHVARTRPHADLRRTADLPIRAVTTATEDDPVAAIRRAPLPAPTTPWAGVPVPGASSFVDTAITADPLYAADARQFYGMVERSRTGSHLD